MATSKAQIFNLALTMLGQSSISDPDGTNVPETACRQAYDLCRQALLEEHPWNFASKRIALAQNSTAPDFEYSYSYDLPSDCIRVHKFYDLSDTYKEESNKILTDSGTLSLVYIYNVEDVTKFPAMFTKILATDLALAVEYRITGQTKMQASLSDSRQKLLVKAKMVDAQKSGEQKVLRSGTDIAMNSTYGIIE